MADEIGIDWPPRDLHTPKADPAVAETLWQKTSDDEFNAFVASHPEAPDSEYGRARGSLHVLERTIVRWLCWLHRRLSRIEERLRIEEAGEP